MVMENCAASREPANDGQFSQERVIPGGGR